MYEHPSSASSEGDDGEQNADEDMPSESGSYGPIALDDDESGDEDLEKDMEPGTEPHSPSLSPRVSTVHNCKTPPRSRRQHLQSTCSNAPREPVIRTQQRTIYTAGRPPWYNTQGQLKEPFVIGICGGSASGKTTVATKIIEELDVPWVTLLSMDSFYKVLNCKQHELANVNQYNFDHPDAFDFDLLITTLRKLKEGRRVDVPIYSFKTHTRENKKKLCTGPMLYFLREFWLFTIRSYLR